MDPPVLKLRDPTKGRSFFDGGNVANMELVLKLTEMGFTQYQAEQACILTGNKNLHEAMEYIFAHPELPRERPAKPEDAVSPMEVTPISTTQSQPLPSPTIDTTATRVASRFESVAAEKRRHEEEQRRKEIEDAMREKKWREEERARVKKRLEDDKKERLEREKERRAAASSTAATPVASTATTTTTTTAPQPIRTYTEAALQIRLPDGTTIRNTFAPTTTIAAVYDFVSSKLAPGTNFVLMTPLPKREFKEEDRNKTLAEVDLAPRGTLTAILSESRGVLRSGEEAEYQSP